MSSPIPGRRHPPAVPDGLLNNEVKGQLRVVVQELLKLWRHVLDQHSGMPSPHAASHLRITGATDPLRTPGTPLPLVLNAASSVGSGGAPADEQHTHALDLLLTTKGDLLSHTGSAYARVPITGSDGDTLVKDAASSAGMKWATSSGAGMLELIEAHDFAAPATSYSLAGLDGDTDDLYFLVFKIIKNTVAAMNVDIQPNGVTTNQETRARYDGTGGSGTLTAAAIRIVFNGGATADDIDFGTLWFQAKTGTDRTGFVEWLEAVAAAGGIYKLSGAFVWNENATNITSLDVVADVANGIKTGSFLRLYKLKFA